MKGLLYCFCFFLFFSLWACQPKQRKPQDSSQTLPTEAPGQPKGAGSSHPSGNPAVSSAINAKDSAGNTQLHRSVTQREIGTVRNILAQGADVNIQNNLGQTPLHLAVLANDLELVELLVETGGADVNAYGGSAGAPIILAQGQILAYLQSKGAKY